MVEWARSARSRLNADGVRHNAMENARRDRRKVSNERKQSISIIFLSRVIAEICACDILPPLKLAIISLLPAKMFNRRFQIV